MNCNIRSGSQFTIVQVFKPNGSTLYENKGRLKANVADSMLWFGKWSHQCSNTISDILLLATRKAIPDDVYDSWNKEPSIVGSDSSEIESPGMNDKKDTDDIISIHGSDTSHGSDIDIKLTSSLQESKTAWIFRCRFKG